MAIARFPSIVIDCPDPGALATFYGAMLDWKVEISWKPDSGHTGSISRTVQVRGASWNAMKPRIQCVLTQ
jgi:hypothetical protein